MTRPEFRNPDELASWLAAAGIDTGAWGYGQTKRIADLWLEYTSGETGFRDDPPARLVEVAQVIIRRGDAILIELAQEFDDGRQRVRQRPPSEKVKPGEDPRAAALRCLGEELGLAERDVTMGEEKATMEEWLDSPSYPGLLTHYRFYRFEATAESLPNADFRRENSAGGDSIRHHLWGWRRNK